MNKPLCDIAYDPDLMVLDDLRAGVVDQCIRALAKQCFRNDPALSNTMRALIDAALSTGLMRVLRVNSGSEYLIWPKPTLHVTYEHDFPSNRARAVWAGYDLSALPMAINQPTGRVKDGIVRFDDPDQ